MTNDAGARTEQVNERLLGQHFVQALNNLLSTARIHQDNNRLLVQCVEQFLELGRQLLRDNDEITLLVAVGGFYLQEEKVIFRRNAAGLIRKMLTFFEERQLDGLKFYQNLSYAALEDITAFARVLNASGRQEEPVAWLMEQTGADRFRWVDIIDPSQTESLESMFADAAASTSGSATSASASRAGQAGQGTRTDKKKEKATDRNGGRQTSGLEADQPAARRQPTPGPGKKKERTTKKAMRTYGYAMNSLHTLSEKLSAGRYAGIGKAVHLVQNMVDLIMDDDNVLLGLSTIRDHDDYTFTHSVNVAILSICLGNRIGLSRTLLGKLGLSGLFHDLGKIDVPLDILNKPGQLSEKERGELRKHSLNSVRRIIRLRASYDKKADILLPPFEHHLKLDLSGYPQTPRKKPLTLLGRIVAIADVYDAITSQRIYRSKFLSPDQALGLMLKGSGTDFDPILLKVFVNMLGVYPLGTILKFEDGDIAMVTTPPDPGQDASELWVMQLKDNGDGTYTKGYSMSLGHWDPERGGFNRQVMESCHPSELGIQPAEFFF